jgi:nucleoid DNA-binding protein
MDQDNSKPEKPTTGRRNRDSDSFRDQIIRYLHDEKGFSWPKAERGFRAVFERIGEAVRSGEVVELPGIGIIKSIVRRGPAKRWWKPLHNVHTRKKSYRVVPAFRRPRRIVFTPYRALDFTPPPSPQEIEARQLAAELLGRTVDDRIMAELQAGVDIHAHRPGAPHGRGALLRRLRELKKRGRHFQDVTFMAGELAGLYWI